MGRLHQPALADTEDASVQGHLCPQLNSRPLQGRSGIFGDHFWYGSRPLVFDNTFSGPEAFTGDSSFWSNDSASYATGYSNIGYSTYSLGHGKAPAATLRQQPAGRAREYYSEALNYRNRIANQVSNPAKYGVESAEEAAVDEVQNSWRFPTVIDEGSQEVFRTSSKRKLGVRDNIDANDQAKRRKQNATRGFAGCDRENDQSVFSPSFEEDYEDGPVSRPQLMKNLENYPQEALRLADQELLHPNTDNWSEPYFRRTARTLTATSEPYDISSPWLSGPSLDRLYEKYAREHLHASVPASVDPAIFGKWP